MTTIRIWDAAVAADRRDWESLHRAWEHREVFAHPAYVALFAQPSDRVLAVYAPSELGWILYPFILRQVEPGVTDITSAYGYGGVYVAGDVGAHAAEFWAAFGRWARSENVATEFIRCSLFDEHQLRYPGEREEKLINVVRSLELDEAALWNDYDHKVRKNVNKAKRSNVTIEADPTGARFDDFIRIYETTMDRREAGRGYYFPRSFFATVIAELAGQFVFVHALHEGRVVSTELALVSAHNVYSFLGGTDEAAFDLRPNDLLKHELILWAKRAGKRRFVLGGGHSMDDGIFRYKRAFAPSGLVPFFVGHRVFDQETYQRLVEARARAARQTDPSWEAPAGFFPAYRA